ncbi:dihydroorotate dehydrogenase [Thiosulfatihalobacter marinus]|uniref:dihydroorotate dehydrogenase n=1 Tax=Thiosulfatihalobacter marinus TaxID=2792481 RepID=UPI0018D87A4C|nr:dihydroorotate dehydrogenase [Thiosulfatihalobacter marinus]
MADMEQTNAMLDELFAEARRNAEAPVSPALLARVLADAEALQPAPRILEAARPRGWRRFVTLLGGWPSVAGLATAALVGVWIGVAGSAGLIGGELGSDLLSLGQESVLADMDQSYAFLVD